MPSESSGDTVRYNRKHCGRFRRHIEIATPCGRNARVQHLGDASKWWPIAELALTMAPDDRLRRLRILVLSWVCDNFLSVNSLKKRPGRVLALPGFLFIGAYVPIQRRMIAMISVAAAIRTIHLR